MTSPSPTSAPRRKKISFSLTTFVFFSILSFRIFNALTIRTFFQPDEYFQSLEPAWRMIFGEGWITWEWRNQLRSIAHPLIFAGVYKITSLVSELCHLAPVHREEVLNTAPKILQAVFATLGDYFTAKLAGKLFGGAAGWTSLLLSIGSAFHYFCSTRTFSNSLETSITIIALCYWPWNQAIGGPEMRAVKSRIRRNNLRISLLLAAFACILRPTNVLIWLCLGSFLMYRSTSRDRVTLVTEAITVGISVLLLNAVIDHRYYGVWTFPPLKFLQFNLLQSLSHFYGTNDWHYYLSQGLPLLLTSFLPLGLYSLFSFLRGIIPSPEEGGTTGQSTAGFQLASTVVTVAGVYSLIAHKEVRFLYPLLPIIHVLSAATLENLSWSAKAKRITIWGMVLINIPITYYLTQVHQRGVIDVVDHLRQWDDLKTVGFLMPCHSTPWQANAMVKEEMWALSCEPPIGMTDAQKASYLDEADQFYADPRFFLSTHLPAPSTFTSIDPKKWVLRKTRYQWPARLIFFEALEETMKEYFDAEGSGMVGGRGDDVCWRGYEECWRGFNTHWHDDGRRMGDVIIWCLNV